VPAEDRIAAILGTRLGGVFGRFGYWFMIIGLLTGFFGMVLSNQDGFGRLINCPVRSKRHTSLSSPA
jgi:hypothetical protein